MRDSNLTVSSASQRRERNDTENDDQNRLLKKIKKTNNKALHRRRKARTHNVNSSLLSRIIKLGIDSDRVAWQSRASLCWPRQTGPGVTREDFAEREPRWPHLFLFTSPFFSALDA